MKLNDPNAFGNDFVAQAVKPGFGSLSKRDLELLIYYLLERDGAVARSSKTYDVAVLLNVPLAKAKAYRRDAYARWRGPFGEEPKREMPKVLAALLTSTSLDVAAKHAGRAARQDGYIPVWIEHPVDRVDFEQAVLDAEGIPRRDHHPDVLFVRFDVLTRIASTYLTPLDTKVSLRALKKLAPTAEEVKDLLTKDITKITWSDVRSAVNGLGAKAATGVVDTKVSDLVSVLFGSAA